MSSAEIGKALAGAFAGIKHATKNSKNPHFKSDYANLEQVLDVVRTEFSKHGLAVVQFPGAIKHENALYTIAITTILIHSSGETLSATMDMPINADKNGKINPPAVGSAVTFGRRYGLAAVAGITQADDDGSAASDFEEAEEDTSALFESVEASKTRDELLAFKESVEQTGDAVLVKAFTTKLKSFKKG